MPSLVKFGKGNAANEQSLITQVDTFIVSICGWERIGIISDTSLDRDYVYLSKGEVEGRYHHLYARWRGYNNFIYNYGYSRWGSAVDYDGEVHIADYNLTPCYNTDFNWWGFGNKDGVWLVWVSGNGGSGTSYFSAFIGYAESYYSEGVDCRPIAVIGHRSDSRWFDENRIVMQNFMFDYVPSLSGTGGTGGWGYLSHKDAYTYMLQYNAPSDRDGSWGHCPIVIFNSSSTNAAENVRGELRHCVYIPGTGLSNGDWVSISGTEYKYFIQKYSTEVAETIGLGPVLVSSGTEWAL